MKQSSAPDDHPGEIADYDDEAKPVNSLFSEQDPIDESSSHSNRVSLLQPDISQFVHFTERYDLTNKAEVDSLVTHLKKHKDMATMRKLNMALQNLANSRERERRIGLAKRSLFPRTVPVEESMNQSPRKAEGLSHLPDPSIHFPRAREPKQSNSLRETMRGSKNRNFLMRASQVSQQEATETLLKRTLATQGAGRRKRATLYDSMPSLPIPNAAASEVHRGLQISTAVSPSGNCIECENQEFSQTDVYPSRKETRRSNRKLSKGDAQSMVGSMTTTNTRRAQKMEQPLPKKLVGYSKRKFISKPLQPAMAESPRVKPKTSQRPKKKRTVQPVGSMPQIPRRPQAEVDEMAFSPEAWEQADENVEFREQEVQILEKDFSVKLEEPGTAGQPLIKEPSRISLPQMPGRQSMPALKEESIFEPRGDPQFVNQAVSSSREPIPSYPSGFLQSTNQAPEQTLQPPEGADPSYFSKELLNNQVLASSNLNKRKEKSLKQLQKRRALPLIDFTKLNKLRLKKLFVQDRDVAEGCGGVPLQERTQRKTQRRNLQASMPESMFMSTHVLHCQQEVGAKMQTLQGSSILKERNSLVADSSFHVNYYDGTEDLLQLQASARAQRTIDHSQLYQSKKTIRKLGPLNTIQNHPNTGGMRQSQEGASNGPIMTQNSVESLGQQRVNHPMPSITDSLDFSSIHHADQSTSSRMPVPGGAERLLLSQKMTRYFKKTSRPKMAQGSGRDSSVEQADREVQRKSLKYARMQQQLTAIVSYRSQVTKKREYIENLLENYPFMANYLDPLRDIYDLTMDEIMYKANSVLHSHQLEQAAVRLQRFWRKRSVMMVSINLIRKQIRATKVIQKAWRQSRWIRVLGKLIRAKHNTAAILIQKFLRGYHSRQQTIELLKGKHLGTNFEFFEAMRLKLFTDAVILIQYYFKRFKKKKEHERQLRLQAQRKQAKERRRKKGLPPLKKQGSTTSQPSQNSSPTKVEKLEDSFSSFNNTIKEGERESSHSSGKANVSQQFLNINQPIVVAELNSSHGSRRSSRLSHSRSRRGSHQESSRSNHQRQSHLRGQKTMIPRQGSFFKPNASSNSHIGSSANHGSHQSQQRQSHMGTPRNLGLHKQASHSQQKKKIIADPQMLKGSKSRQNLEKNNTTILNQASEKNLRGSPAGKKQHLARKGTRPTSKEAKMTSGFS